MVDRLDEFLDLTAKRRFSLGHWDCGLWLADWYTFKTGKPDPAAHLRGQPYDAESLSEHMLSIVNSLNLVRVDIPKREDIGLVQISDALIVGAICSGSRWLVLGKGIAGIKLEHVKLINCWRVA